MPSCWFPEPIATNVIEMIFSIILIIIFMFIVKILAKVINKMFSMSNILFPMLLTLILSSGAAESFAVYSSLSAFVLNSEMSNLPSRFKSITVKSAS